MRILILGGDGYLGWPTAMRLSARGNDVCVVDNFLRRKSHVERGTASLTPITSLRERIATWKTVTGHNIEMFVGDICDYPFLDDIVSRFAPDAVIHYAELPSAPFSMIDASHAVQTQVNNIVGTLNLLFALRERAPSCHLIKLGSMGEYGTPNIDIEEGFINIQSNGRSDVLPFPKQPGSFYHLSKVHDSNNISFACKAWGLSATDLNQGVVYGIDTEETSLHESLLTRYDYDEIFGTVLNRFCVQAVAGRPITPYGSGKQVRGFLDIRDTLQCVELALDNAPNSGEYRVFNQFTEIFSVMDLAEKVKAASEMLGLHPIIAAVENPRFESEQHYYNPVHSKLLDLGLKPHFLSETLVESIVSQVSKFKDRIDTGSMDPTIVW